MDPGSSSVMDDKNRRVVFATTRWSVVLSAGDPSSPDSFDALSHLCRSYWFPLYAYVRRRGYSPHDAQDLTQSFFAAFLEKGRFTRANQSRGRFRSFLLASMKHFISDDRDRRQAQKRGGNREIISIDETQAEARYLADAHQNISPDVLFEKRWATTLLADILERLRDEFQHTGKVEIFDAFKAHLWGNEQATPIQEIAQTLGLSLSAAKVTLHRLRKRYRERLRESIAETVESPDQIEGEIRHLARTLRGERT